MRPYPLCWVFYYHFFYILVNFNYKFCEVPIEMNKFKNRITDYLEVMHKKNPPPPPEDCDKCLMHKHFYDPKKLK